MKKCKKKKKLTWRPLFCPLQLTFFLLIFYFLMELRLVFSYVVYFPKYGSLNIEIIAEKFFFSNIQKLKSWPFIYALSWPPYHLYVFFLTFFQILHNVWQNCAEFFSYLVYLSKYS